MRALVKLTLRTIRSFFGRYTALLLIVTLSVGFFSGLKITGDAMEKTCEDYLTEQNFYDLRLISTIGFTDRDVEELSRLDRISEAEGLYSADVMMECGQEIMPFKLLSVPEAINLPSLSVGRMPETKNECLGDAKFFHEDDLGSTVRISDENTESTLGQLGVADFTVVGLVRSPLYLGIDRGSSGIGSGTLKGFIYVPSEAFIGDAYSEIDLTLKDQAKIYSDDYEKLISESKPKITERCTELVSTRYRTLLDSTGLTPEQASAAGIREPELYVLTREENPGYISFRNDSSIVSEIANIFPVFFIIIAMLVCITTMTRMVDEERTQSGVLKAMGFSDLAVTGKYLLYAGSATVLGWAAGFFLGTWGLPKVFWYAYSALYNFSPMKFLFSPLLAALTLGISLAGILGSTWLSCRQEMRSEPARLIRPRAAKSGKRILLERFNALWRRLTFLQKITLRNMFRYKQRFIMMLVGIGCCTGLVVTAFGVRDSMIGIGTLQFENVQTYDLEAGFSSENADEAEAALSELNGVEKWITCSVRGADLINDSERMNIKLISFKTPTDSSISGDSAISAGSAAENFHENPLDFWSLRDGSRDLTFPGAGEAIINTRTAEKLSVSIGDIIVVQDSDMKETQVTVSGIFDCYVNNYAIISADTYEGAFGKWRADTAMLSVSGSEDEVAEKLSELPCITSVVQLSITKNAVDNALDCLNYVIWIVVLFSGALAFVVIFNLTNINLAERSREIATVEVLGFYPNETDSYVLRENLILSVIAGVIGLPLGFLFHKAVMHMVVIDFVAFNIHIEPMSYVLAFICTVLFAAAVNLFMKRQIRRIHMAESLKAVE